MNDALKRQQRDADPGRMYSDEICEAVDWWAALTRPFHRRQSENAIHVAGIQRRGHQTRAGEQHLSR